VQFGTHIRKFRINVLSVNFIGAIPLCDSKINIKWASIHNNIFDYKEVILAHSLVTYFGCFFSSHHQAITSSGKYELILTLCN
jgi:hypothetical protein